MTTPETITERPGRRVVLLVDTDELTLTDFTFGPGEQGPDPHVHREHSDSFHVVEGELTVVLRDRSLTAGASTFITIPPGVIHSFANDGGEPLRFYNLHTPSCGFAEYLRGARTTFDQHAPADEGRDPEGVVIVSLPA